MMTNSPERQLNIKQMSVSFQEQKKIESNEQQKFENLYKSFFNATHQKQTLNKQRELSTLEKIDYTLNALKQSDNTNQFLLFPGYQKLQKIFQQITTQIIRAFLKKSQSQQVKREINSLKEMLNNFIRETSNLKQKLQDGSKSQDDAIRELNLVILQKKTFALQHLYEQIRSFLRVSQTSIRNLANNIYHNWKKVGNQILEQEEKKQEDAMRDQIDKQIDQEKNQKKKASLQQYRTLIKEIQVQIKKSDRGLEVFLHELIQTFFKSLRQSLIDVLDTRLRQSSRINGSFQQNMSQLKRLLKSLIEKFQSIQLSQVFDTSELASYSKQLGKISFEAQTLLNKGININEVSFTLFNSKAVKNKLAMIFQTILKGIDNHVPVQQSQAQVCELAQQLLISPSYTSKICYTFDLDTKSVVKKEKMNLGVTFRTILSLQRSCLVASDPNRSTTFLQLFPKNIIQLPDMLVARGQLSLCRYKKTIIFATGGRNAKKQDIQSAQLYDMQRIQWKKIPNLCCAKSSHGSVTLRDCVFTFGGLNQNNGQQNQCEKYNIKQQQSEWVILSVLNNPIFEQSCRAIEHKGMIYVFQRNFAYKFSISDEGQLQCDTEVDDFDEVGYASQHYTAMKIRNNQLVWAFRNSVFSYDLKLF